MRGLGDWGCQVCMLHRAKTHLATLNLSLGHPYVLQRQMGNRNPYGNTRATVNIIRMRMGHPQAESKLQLAKPPL